MVELLQLAAAIYLAAGVCALLGLALPAPRVRHAAVWGLVAGALAQAASFGSMHGGGSGTSLMSLSLSISVMAWMAVIFLLFFMWRLRLDGLAAVVGPVAFLAVFISTFHVSAAAKPPNADEGSFPHAHILLSSGGLALLGIAGVAGLFFLLENRRIKSKRPIRLGLRLPSLEALDRINRAALAVGFPLLTLGVITGSLWLHKVRGTLWVMGGHEIWTTVAWGIYAGLVAARFVGRQGSRQAAASALAGFVFLLFAVVGVGLLT